jgi:AcrR family transcriptional regulator
MSKLQPRATITREHILQSAIELIKLDGIAGFTLEKVAKSAGVSKGGLLYHFPTKEALIEGLMEKTFASFERLYFQYLEGEPPGNGRQLRAYIRANLDESLVSLDLASMLRAASLDSPKIKLMISKKLIHWRNLLADDGIPKIRVMVIRQAADAYWVDYLLGTHQEDQGTREKILEELLKLTYTGVGEEPPVNL